MFAKYNSQGYESFHSEDPGNLQSGSNEPNYRDVTKADSSAYNFDSVAVQMMKRNSNLRKPYFIHI